MLRLFVKLCFFTNAESSDALKNDLSTRNIIRPAVNFDDGYLFSGTVFAEDRNGWIKLGEQINVRIDFPTIDMEVYNLICNKLFIGAVYNVQAASKIIGKCEVISYQYE